MHLEVWSDIACPWCYIGKRRLERALAEFEHAEAVRVTWRSFELDPGAPDERPGELAALLARKYGIPLEQAREAQRSLTAVAAEEGLQFRLEVARSGSTFDGHRLVHLAAEHGAGDALKERLLQAYFTEGRLVSEPQTLRAAAADVGLPEGEVEALLSGERFAQEVRDDERAASELGIASVPTFIVDRSVGVTGAQPPELLLEMLRRAWAASAGVPAGGVSGG
jgi:predicted DsbA family dithiol-disulfide isomerase